MPQAENANNLILSKNLFPVVGIGASAGGLEAFKKFVKAIPEKSGMAYILVQHLHPGHSSALPDILQRETNVPVHEISNNEEVNPDNIYIIPSNKVLMATDGILKLSPRPSNDQKNMPIDIFFSSLADIHQSHAIGIVLSGTGADGTIGLKNIKDQGGITFAQDIDSAAYDAMPQNAINANVVDFILPPESMPQKLLDLNRTFQILPTDDLATPEQITEEESFKRILANLRISNGVDFTYYKQSTIRRRILRRLAILKLEKVADYFDYLKHNKSEPDILFQDMLIPVTAFFRDPKTFENLCETVLPELIKNKSSANPLRVWIAGCSTGEEAYSIAICLYEYLSDKVSTIKIQIFATDLSERAIVKARTGIYAMRDLDGVFEARLQQFFTKINGHYQIKKMIRNMCVFAIHNFLKDPPFAKMDLISCRNVLIYLEPFLQKKAFATFHYALSESGYLLLGKSETTGSSSDLFLPFGKKDKLYTRKSTQARFIAVASERTEEGIKDKDYGISSNEKRKDDYQKNADDILLSKYTPSGVIVNDQLDIVQFRGSTGDFLEASPGKASWNVLKMARAGLSFELRNALHKSKKSKEVYSKENIPINNGKNLVTIEVIPLLDTTELHFLVLFKDSIASQSRHSVDKKLINNVKDDKDIRIEKLEKELFQAREDMRGISEDQEAVNEELQSANEELLSGSEELQSLNEEMETSKEELQSTNEELITVNQELFDRNEQLSQARLYAEAIVTTIHEPFLVLREDYKIISANNSFYKLFSISEEESIGKPLFDLQNNQWDIPGLRSQLLKISKQREKFLEWEITYEFPLAGKRSICLNAQPIQGINVEHYILLAFNDITLWKERELADKKNADDLKRILEALPQITFTATPKGDITYFNQFFLYYSGLTLEEAMENGWNPLVVPEMVDKVKKAWACAIETGIDFMLEFQLKRKEDNVYRWHVGRASPIRNNEGTITSWVGAATDVHDQKTKEQMKDEFITIASHELKTPLTSAKAYMQLLQRSMEESNDINLAYVQKASASVDRLHYLIAELLDANKIRNGKLDLNLSVYNFNEMVAAALESVQLTSPTHSIILTGKIGQPVTGDKDRLQQVIINLLTNAIKYSPKADKVLINTMEENGMVKVSIKDSGFGIRKENLEKIFEIYYREEGQAINFQGLGLGLFICREIIQRHKGEIWAESDSGKGSIFYFTVPINAGIMAT